MEMKTFKVSVDDEDAFEFPIVFEDLVRQFLVQLETVSNGK